MHRIGTARDAAAGGGGAAASLNLLRDALKKLEHPNLDIGGIPLEDLGEAQRLANDIQKRGKELATEVYECKKQAARLGRLG